MHNLTNSDIILVLSVCSGLTALFWWAFRKLQNEEWQFIASVPFRKTADNSWQAFNLTYYGFFSATAYAIALTVLLLLTGSCGISPAHTLTLIFPVLGICVIASSALAQLIEKKTNTFSVGAAVFAGTALTSTLIPLLNYLSSMATGINTDPMIIISAMAISYTFGEGVGRLACISFGCCYGFPIENADPRIRSFLEKIAFVFKGSTRKISYASGLEGKKVFPIQAITAIICSAAGLGGTLLFLMGMFWQATALSMIVTLFWRFVSEFMRYDYRGGGRLSVYQIMSLVSIIMCMAPAVLIKQSYTGKPDVLNGLANLWDPALILLIILIWAALFLHTGVSKSTSATVRFTTNPDCL